MNNLLAALLKAAESDLRIARKNGVMAVTGTKLGNLEVNYAKGVGYSIWNFNTSELYIESASKKAALDFLVTSYQVAS